MSEIQMMGVTIAGEACEDVSDPSAAVEGLQPAPGPAVMSKRQLKRLDKHRIYMAGRPEARRAERQRRKDRRLLLRDQQPLPQSDGGVPHRPGVRPASQMKFSDVRVVLDLSFDALMTDRDLAKCMKQVQRCYALNRRAELALRLCLTGLQGRCLQVLERNTGWRNWNLETSEQHFTELFDKDKVTYLSSDSDNVVDSLESGRVYVIGALVDHNHHKRVCLNAAEERGLRHGRLPIGEHVNLNCRKTLTIDRVYEILLGRIAGREWEEVLCAALPARSGVKPLASLQQDEESRPGVKPLASLQQGGEYLASLQQGEEATPAELEGADDASATGGAVGRVGVTCAPSPALLVGAVAYEGLTPGDTTSPLQPPEDQLVSR